MRKILFRNHAGIHAEKYELVHDKTFAVGKGDFSLGFWLETKLCGLSRPPRSFFSLETMLIHYDRVEPMKPIDFKDLHDLGGVAIASRSCSIHGKDGFSISILPYQAYLDVGFCDKNMNGFWQFLDDRPHYAVFVFDRDDCCHVYCDAVEIGDFSISSSKDRILESNVISLGADVEGAWGLQNGTISDFRFFASALTSKEVEQLYLPHKKRLLLKEGKERLKDLSYVTKNERGELEKALIVLKDSKASYVAFESYQQVYERVIGGGKPKAVFGMISDIHVLKAKPDCLLRLRRALEDIGNLPRKVDGLIVGGDVSHSSAAEDIDYAYKNLEIARKKAGIRRLTTCVGNHELWLGIGGGYATGMPAWLRNVKKYRKDNAISPNYYLNNMAGYPFMVLNCETPPDNRYTRHETHLSDQQLQWVDQQLATFEKKKQFVFVMLHQPFQNTYPLTDKASGDWAVGEQDAELRSILSKYHNFLYLCGHMHQAFNVAGILRVDGAFPEMQMPGLDFTPKNFCIPGSGYVMYVYEDRILFRARDLMNGRWYTAFDKELFLKDGWIAGKIVNSITGERKIWWNGGER